MLKLTLKQGPQAFDLFEPTKLKENLLSLLVIGTILVTLVLTFVYGIINKFVMSKAFGYTLMTIYIAFLIAATVISLESKQI